MSPRYFVAVAGNIGVGKTTVTTLISERFGWRAFFEKVVENPYLEDFYRDMKRWSFHSQIFFLTHRFTAHLEIQAYPTSCVLDRTIYEDAEIFAENLYQSGFMDPRDYASYRSLYEAMAASLTPPDVILYLRASAWTLLTRIRKRGRPFERSIDKEYLLRLNIGYEKWIEKASSQTKVLIVDMDRLDVERDSSDLEEILEGLRRMCP